jgi:hypothetical protein
MENLKFEHRLDQSFIQILQQPEVGEVLPSLRTK